VPGTHAALVAPDDFRRVQERLADRRTNYSPHKVGAFLLSGLAVCGNCGSHMIGVSRRQSWRRRKDNTQQASSYRYYQCGSHTNQGICAYHTQRADQLEGRVRDLLESLDPKQLATAGNEAALIAEWQAETKRRRDHLQQIDRRLAQTLDAAAKEKLSREELRARGLSLALERLKTEEELEEAERRAESYTSTAERRRARAAARERLVSQWNGLVLNERRELLRSLLDRVVVGDDEVRLSLRP